MNQIDFKSLVNILWISGTGLQGALCLVLLIKRSWRTFPAFTFYSVFSFIMSVVLLLLRDHRRGFFYSYWISEEISIVLGFVVVYEVFRRLFSTHRALLKLARLIFQWTILAIFGVAFLVSMVQAPSAHTLPNLVLVMEEATRVVEVGLLIFLFGASAAFGLHWRQAEFGIALGLGLFVAVELTAVTLRFQIGGAWEALNVVRILAFDTSLLVWLGYLLAPERATGNVEVPKRAQLEQWNQAVTELISR